MDDFYIFVTGGIGILLICAYIIMYSLLGFRNKTTNRFMRVLIVGIIAYFTSGGLSTFLWVITYIYGIYIIIISFIVFTYGKIVKSTNHISINGNIIINFIIDYVAEDKSIDFIKKK